MTRYYEIKHPLYGVLGPLPSVTTVLAKTYNRGRYGNIAPGSKLAANIKYRAEVGTEVHTLAECFLLGKEWPCSFQPTDEALLLFQQLKPIIKGLTIFRGPSGNLAIEKMVYSVELMVGGRVDLVTVTPNGALEVWDLKTAGSKRKADQVWGYMLQAAAYAQCIKEMSGHPVKRCVLLFVYANKGRDRELNPYTEEVAIEGATLTKALDDFRRCRDEFQRIIL